MKRAWQVAGGVSLAFSVFVVAEASQYGFLDEYGPGAGFFAILIGSIMGLMSLALVVKVSFVGIPAEKPGSVLPRGPDASRVLLVLGGIIGVVLLLRPLGFRITMLLFLTHMLISLGARRPWVVAAMALTGSVGTYHVFYHWLRVPLPIGSVLGF
jgi:hypothetical protein